MNVHTVLRNEYGGLYKSGASYTPTQWTNFTKTALDILRRNGKCTVRTLKLYCQIPVKTAWRAINATMVSNGVSIKYAQRHGCAGIGCLVGIMHYMPADAAILEPVFW